MKVFIVVGIAFLMSGCTEAPHEPVVEHSHNEVSGRVEGPKEISEPNAPATILEAAHSKRVSFSNCVGVYAETDWPTLVDFPFQAPSGWQESARPVASYRIYAMTCERISTPTGAIIRDATWGIELHSNISSQGQPQWNGSYDGLFAGLSLIDPGPSSTWLNWPQDRIHSDPSMAIQARPSDKEFSLDVNTTTGKLSVSALYEPTNNPEPRAATTMRLVTNAEEKEFYDLTYSMADAGLAFNCKIHADNGYAAASVPAPESPLNSCSMFVNTDFDLNWGRVP